jgi:hypothetical protein
MVEGVLELGKPCGGETVDMWRNLQGIYNVVVFHLFPNIPIGGL